MSRERAQFRTLVKRILRRYGCPAGTQRKATQAMLEQAEMLTAQWVVTY